MTTTTASTQRYRDTNLSIDERVDDLIGRLTLEQKAGQLTQYFYLGVAMNIPADFDIESVPEEHRTFLEQPLMVRGAIRNGSAGSVLFVKDAALINELQRIAVEESEHGIPLLVGYDVVHGLRTNFPVPIAMAATWDPEESRAAQEIAARECRAVGINWTFAPVLDVARDPRWGRIVEGPGEDPVLGAAFGAAQVHGFQGDLGEKSVLAGPKHFIGYGASRGGRDYEDVELSDNEFWNVYVPPFRAAIDAGAANIMTAYMDLNGVPASGNPWLLHDVLRRDLGFEGFTVSDANAVRSLEMQHFAKDLTDAAARAISAGLDMEMAMFDPAYSRLASAVQEGLVSESTIDTAARRVLAAKFRLGLFENPFVDEEAASTVLDERSHRDAARVAAEKSLVLLKNEGGTLPLRSENLASVAVIGELAASKRDTLGPWVFDHRTDEAITIVEALQNRLGSDRVVHAPGASIPERISPSPFDNMDPTVPTRADDYDDDAEIDRAVAVATASDVAIVVVGQRQNQIGEFASISRLDLPGRQLEQLQRIHATGTPVIVVSMSGRPLDLRWADEHVASILQAWYPGTRGGEAVANVLLGDVSPAGRLPFTWPRHVGQVPMIHSHYRTFQPDNAGARYTDEASTPLYPFGHGLTYAGFEYVSIRSSSTTINVGETVSVAVVVRNTSSIDADEVVQLYTHQRHGSASRPVRELKAFSRVRIPAGDEITVEFQLGPDQLRYWSSTHRDYVQDATVFDLWAGPSSLADLHTTFEVTRG